MTTRTNTTILTASLIAGLALAASPARAVITAVTGQTTWLGTPPPASGPGQLTGFTAYAWDERQNVSLNVVADMVNNPGSSNAPLAGPLAGNFDTHFIHFEPIPGAANVQGTVTFSGPILGVIFRAINLDGTDATAGALGTVYPTGYPFRGLNGAPSNFSINANTLTFDFWAMAPNIDVVQVRVLTPPTPAPGPVALMGLGGLLCARRRRK
jgi:MYXO-CTERM domain-containing protein